MNVAFSIENTFYPDLDHINGLCSLGRSEALALILPEGSNNESLSIPTILAVSAQDDYITYVGGNPVSFIVGGEQQLIGGNEVDTWALIKKMPFQHALTVPSNSKLSAVLSEGCKIYYVKPELYGLGRCTVKSKMGHDVLAYDAERTLCDILRSRSRIDSQIFAEAMKAYAARKVQNWNKLRDYADAFRVTKLLRQYLEVLI